MTPTPPPHPADPVPPRPDPAEPAPPPEPVPFEPGPFEPVPVPEPGTPDPGPAHQPEPAARHQAERPEARHQHGPSGQAARHEAARHEAGRGGDGHVRVLQVLATSGGGVGRHVAELAEGLARAGHEVRVAGPAATDAAFGFGAAGLPFDPVEISDRPRPAADLAAARRLRRLAARADVVHAHGLRAGALAAIATRTLRRRPRLVVTLHNALVSGGRIARVHRVLEGIVARGADTVLVVSGDIGDAMRARGARNVARALVPAPPRPATRSPKEVRRDLGVDGTLLVTVARLAPQKGLEHLAAAVALLDRPDVTAVLAGDGPLEPELRGTPLVLLGRRHDVPDLLAAADLVVVPSLWEGQPLVVQEALRAGAAIVATDSGGTAEVAGDAAALVRPGEPAELAAAVRRLLDDPGEAAALRRRARARAAQLPTAADATQQVTAVYADAIATLRTRGPRRSAPASG